MLGHWPSRFSWRFPQTQALDIHCTCLDLQLHTQDAKIVDVVNKDSDDDDSNGDQTTTRRSKSRKRRRSMMIMIHDGDDKDETRIMTMRTVM